MVTLLSEDETPRNLDEGSAADAVQAEAELLHLFCHQPRGVIVPEVCAHGYQAAVDLPRPP